MSNQLTNDLQAGILLSKAQSALKSCYTLLSGGMLAKFSKKMDGDELEAYYATMHDAGGAHDSLKPLTARVEAILTAQLPATAAAPAAPVTESREPLQVARLRGTLIGAACLLHDAGHHVTANDLEAETPAILLAAAPVVESRPGDGWVAASGRLPEDGEAYKTAFLDKQTNRYMPYGDAFYHAHEKQWMDDTTSDEGLRPCHRKIALWLDRGPIPALPAAPLTPKANSRHA